MLVLLIVLCLGATATATETTIDRIESVEAEETQIVITTTKNGSPDQLKIHIELIDILENKQVNPVDLSGLWLTITRGRYTIPFLRPDTWYGVRFRSENVANGERVVHEEQRLVKTAPRSAHPHPDNTLATLPPPSGVFGVLGVGSAASPLATHAPNDHERYEVVVAGTKNTDEQDEMDVRIHRSLDGMETYESVYVTVSWKQKSRHSNHTTGIVNLRVICENTETKEEIKLKGNEDSVTIEITMDQKYDIEEVDNTRHQIQARITPLKCHQICWTSHLELSSTFGDFRRDLSSNCSQVAGATSTTFLREIKRVHVRDSVLIVETQVAESEYGIVRIVLQRLGNSSAAPIVKSFDTTTSNGRFEVGLDPDQDDGAIYAVDYEYTKTRPFHYSSNAHFLVESPAINSTRVLHPMVEISTAPDTFDYKHDKPNSVLKPEPPFLLLSRSSMFPNEMIINMEPFCGEPNATRVRLEDRYPQHQIDAVPFLCGLQPNMYFCDKNQTYERCADTTFCFSTTILLKTHSYDSEMRCLNMTQHFPELKACAGRFSPIIFIILASFSNLLFRFSE